MLRLFYTAQGKIISNVEHFLNENDSNESDDNLHEPNESDDNSHEPNKSRSFEQTEPKSRTQGSSSLRKKDISDALKNCQILLEKINRPLNYVKKKLDEFIKWKLICR